MKNSKLITILLALMALTPMAWAQVLSGSGTTEDPYLISSSADWNTFAQSVTGGTFYFNGGGEITPVNSYYTVLLGTEQGHPAVSDPDIQPIGSPTGTYSLSNLTAYVNGLKYGDTFYYAPSITQTIELSAGWNWISLYIEFDNPGQALLALEEALGEHGLKISAMDDYTTYEDGGRQEELTDCKRHKPPLVTKTTNCIPKGISNKKVVPNALCLNFFLLILSA